MSLRVLDNEKALLNEIAKGDTKAFSYLFDTYYHELGEYVFRLTESTDATEDILQEVFLKIWQKRESLPTLNRFTYYLFILSRNLTLNYLRKKANEYARGLEWVRQFDDRVQAVDNPDPGMEISLLLDDAVAQLPARQQKVYLLSRRERLKYADIAKKLDISPETVKKHLQLAAAAIEQYLKRHWETP